MSTLGELPGWARALLDEQPVARLAYADADDHPRVLPITFAVAADAVWSAIDDKPKRTREPARLRHLARRPAAALCVDRYDEDWTRLAWVQLLGDVEIVARGVGTGRARRPRGPLRALPRARAAGAAAAARARTRAVLARGLTHASATASPTRTAPGRTTSHHSPSLTSCLPRVRASALSTGT